MLQTAPRRIEVLDVWFHPSLPSPEKSCEPEVFSPSYGAESGEGLLVGENPNFSYQLQCGLFQSCQDAGELQLVYGYFTSVFSCRIIVSMEGGNVQDLIFLKSLFWPFSKNRLFFKIIVEFVYFEE